MTRNPFCTLVLVATCGALLSAQNDPRIINVPANISGLPRIEGPVLDAVLGLSKTRLSASMGPVVYALNGRLAVTILSNRAIIARNNASRWSKVAGTHRQTRLGQMSSWLCAEAEIASMRSSIAKKRL